VHRGGGPSDGSSKATPSASQRGGTLVVGSTVDVDAWNEYVSQQTFASNILRRVYARLAQEQGDAKDHPPNFSPLLASSWSFSPDGLTLRFTLNDATWSDGTPLTAKDVRFTWSAQTSPEVGWTGASFKERIKDVQVVDPHTVEFHFDVLTPRCSPMRSKAAFFRSTSSARFLSRHGGRTTGRKRGSPRAPSFSRAGGRARRSSSPGIRATFRSDRPFVDKVAVRIVPDVGNLETQLAAGAIDYVEGIPPQDAKRLASTPGLSLLVFENPMFDYIGWNGAKKPFDDPDVRRALTLGIDRKAIVEDLLYGYGRISTGPLLQTGGPPTRRFRRGRTIPKRRADPGVQGIRRRSPFDVRADDQHGNRVREAVTLKIQEQLARSA
jgi:peptide/nickel transport system substrate-binding protein